MLTSLSVYHAPLLTETTCGRNTENHEKLKKSQTVANRQVQHRDPIERPGIGLTKKYTNSARWHNLLPIPASGQLLCGIKKHYYLENVEIWTRNFYRTQIANKSRHINCSSYFHWVAPRVTKSASRPFSRLHKAVETRQRL